MPVSEYNSEPHFRKIATQFARFVRITCLCSMVLIAGVTCRAQAARPIPTASPLPTPVPLTPTADPLRIAQVPILMYHYISTPPANADRIRRDLSVSPENFEAQLKYLSDNGYKTISLYDLHANLSSGAPLPPKSIILTFDDGYRDAYEHAFPLLRKYGMVGTFFVVTDFASSANPDYMHWDQIQEISRAGMNIESHSRTHIDLRNRDLPKLIWETLGPLEAIEAYTGKRPRFFCYPFGRYDDDVIRVLKSEYMLGAVTTAYGKTHRLSNALTWDRVRIHGDTTLAEFAVLIQIK